MRFSIIPPFLYEETAAAAAHCLSRRTLPLQAKNLQGNYSAARGEGLRKRAAWRLEDDGVFDLGRERVREEGVEDSLISRCSGLGFVGREWRGSVGSVGGWTVRGLKLSMMACFGGRRASACPD